MESIGRLAGGVAHDFNNLLSVILSYTEFALDELPKGNPLVEDLREVQKAGERAADLTRQLLAFSRKQVMQPKIIDLNGIVSGVEKMLRRVIGEHIVLQKKLAPDLGGVKADPGQMEQVLINLAINAQDAMPEGGRLTLETANVVLDEDYAAKRVGAEPGRFVMLAVTDTGMGMDPETLAQIFEPFFSTKGPGKGTGLGLSTVHGIIKQSNGHIWTYGVLSASSGAEALQIGRAHPGEIHLVLTDVVMPEMSGKRFMDQFLRDRPHSKVLFMSGYTDDAVVHNGVLDAGTHFIGKPFTQANLTAKVREILDGDPHGTRTDR